ncbi:MAG: hypothetical protein AAGD25_15965 [Cyanobacteria bacterium P01_F01_bin.150]
MTRFELLGCIMNHLHQLTDVELQALLTTLESEITDETVNAITYGTDDTEHLLSSQQNAEDLKQAVQELSHQELIIPDASHAA